MRQVPLISIIVPIYNIDAYLKKCVNSIINQTYRNLEIILVNDGSTDQCSAICDDFAKTDSRIKVIHKSNGGLADARNVGMKLATGEYIGFVDSDDWIDNDMYEVLITLIQEHGADIAEVGCRFIFEKYVKEVTVKDTIVMDNIRATECFLDRSLNILAAVYVRLYHKSIIEKLEFPVGRIHEDGFFTYKALYYSNKYVYSNQCKYNYLQQRPGSIMANQIKSKNVIDVICAFEERNVFFKNEKQKILYDKSKVYYYRTLLTYYWEAKRKLPSEISLIKEISDKLISATWDILKIKYFGIRKIKYILFRIDYFFYRMKL